MFCALVQHKVEGVTSNYDNMSAVLKQSFLKLKTDPCNINVDSILESEEFEELYKKIMHDMDGTESKMTIEYIKDVSSLLALVAAVRDSNFELHLQAEREIIKHCFAFDHVNYARYLSYQQVYLRDLQRENHPAIKDLNEGGFGGSISGEPFSTLHGDLITEIFNGQTKHQAGPHRTGISTNIVATNRLYWDYRFTIDFQ